MIFVRTNSGLSNSRLFFKVDATIYVEGGDSVNIDDVKNGQFSSSSSDVRFWQSLFSYYFPEKKFQFCCVGSKETVKKIANDIKSKKIFNVIVAMDRDFDHINGKKIISENVLYTYGYSWENDSWNDFTILQSFCSLSGSCKNNIENEELLTKNISSSFFFKIRRAVFIDAILSQYNCSLFDRKKPNRYIMIPDNGNPQVNIKQLKKSFDDVRTTLGKPIFKKSNITTNAYYDCFGHLVAEYGYRLLSFLLSRKENLPKIAKEYANGMVVEKFLQALQQGIFATLKNHYSEEFLKIKL